MQQANKEITRRITSFFGVVLFLIGSRELNELIFTVIGILVTALLGYIFKLKRDGKSKDSLINSIAKELTGVAKNSAEEEMKKSAIDNSNLTQERIAFLNALEKAKNEMDGVDEVESTYELEECKSSAEAAEEVGDFTSGPVEAPSASVGDLSDEIKKLAEEQAERLKKKLSK